MKKFIASTANVLKVLLPGLLLGASLSYAAALPGIVPPLSNVPVPIQGDGADQQVSVPTTLNNTGTANSPGLVVGKGGYVGIGTLSPLSGLDVRNISTNTFGGKVLASNYCDQSGIIDAIHCVNWAKVSRPAQNDDLPIGSITPVSGTSCPTGWTPALGGRYPRGVMPGELGSYVTDNVTYAFPSVPDSPLCANFAAAATASGFAPAGQEKCSGQAAGTANIPCYSWQPNFGGGVFGGGIAGSGGFGGAACQASPNFSREIRTPVTNYYALYQVKGGADTHTHNTYKQTIYERPGGNGVPVTSDTTSSVTSVGSNTNIPLSKGVLFCKKIS